MGRRKRKAMHCFEMNDKRWKESQNNLVSSNSTCKNESVPPKMCERLRNLQDSDKTGRNPICDEIKMHNVPDEYIFVNTADLNNLLTSVKCSTCGSKSLSFDYSASIGFYRNIKLICSTCTELISKMPNKVECSANLNIQITNAFSFIGKGYSAIEKFCMAMNMTPYSSSTYKKYVEKLFLANCNLTKTMFELVHCEIKKSYTPSLQVPDVYDIAVSFDGTWLTRGHSSLIGVGCVIDILTGYVIDYEVMSKICSFCRRTKDELGEDSAEFHVWYEGHKKFCDMNHSGSSSSMEMKAASVMWKRSLDFGFRYMTILSDGDAKTFNYLCEQKIYGSNAQIKKEECVNHVSKRLGTALRTAVKDWRTRGVKLGGKQYGSLKDTTINKLTKYYQRAILRNEGSVNEMKTAIYATLFHSISSDKKPQHQKCPAGTDSWCFYNSAIANGVKPGPHKLNVGTPINEEFLPKILPIYQRLASSELLERCIRCKTQNANESLHNMIWSRCSKDVFVFKKRVDHSVGEVISEYNKGITYALKETFHALGLKFGCHTARLAKVLDLRKKSFRQRRLNSKYQHARKLVKEAKAKRRYLENKKEGTTYKAGFF